MTDDPVDLDGHRSSAGKIASEIRRHAIRESEGDQETLRRRQQELEAQLSAGASRSWPEVAAKVQYLIRLYAETPEAQDARHRKLIKRALADVARLLAKADR
jgi:hypothetical protein